LTTRTSPEVVLDRVSRRFGQAIALDRVSATIPPGQFVAIIGRSGAGKTTLLRALCGATSISEGSIRFGPAELAGLSPGALRRHRAGVGMIYQQFNLVRRLVVVHNVLIGRLGRLTGVRRWAALLRWFADDDWPIATRCLHHVGLLDRAWQRTDTLSGGEQQRVAIAKALCQEPRIVLGDEPIASLDVANAELVMETLRDVSLRSGLTVVATLHHVDYARSYADRVLGLRTGRLVFDGPPEGLTPAALRDIFGDTVAMPARPGGGENAVEHGSLAAARS
jgi:phosphonate transport system ATP-binding protein